MLLPLQVIQIVILFEKHPTFGIGIDLILLFYSSAPILHLTPAPKRMTKSNES
jgi:hypothetical protein